MLLCTDGCVCMCVYAYFFHLKATPLGFFIHQKQYIHVAITENNDVYKKMTTVPSSYFILEICITSVGSYDPSMLPFTITKILEFMDACGVCFLSFKKIYKKDYTTHLL